MWDDGRTVGKWEMRDETDTTWTKLINRNTAFHKTVISEAIMIGVALEC